MRATLFCARRGTRSKVMVPFDRGLLLIYSKHAFVEF